MLALDGHGVASMCCGQRCHADHQQVRHIGLGRAQIQEDMKEQGVEWNMGTHALVVEAALVRRDVKAMLSALEAMKEAGFSPPAALVDRVVQRLEREGATVLLVSSCLRCRASLLQLPASSLTMVPRDNNVPN